MRVHLIDGTYELFRCFFGAPPAQNTAGREVGAVRALLRSITSWLSKGDLTHAGVAFDHVIESFRNELFAGYKTGEGLDPALYSQFELAERAVRAMGITVWSMVEFEADDALATAALRYVEEPEVEQVIICSPDKDLAQCVRGQKIVTFDRLRQVTLDEAGVKQKFGVPPAAIPDLLALVGDSADGIPGIARWGLKSAAAVLAHYGHIESIPDDISLWSMPMRGGAALAQNLAQHRQLAYLYRRLATLRYDVPLPETLADLAWRGANRVAMEALCSELEDPGLVARIPQWATL